METNNNHNDTIALFQIENILIDNDCCALSKSCQDKKLLVSDNDDTTSINTCGYRGHSQGPSQGRGCIIGAKHDWIMNPIMKIRYTGTVVDMRTRR